MKKLLSLSLVSALMMMGPAHAQSNLVFAYWGDPAELPPFEQIVSDYEAANPDVQIQVQHAPWSGYFTRLDAQLAAHAGPDVFFITNVPAYAARNQLEPLDDYITKSDFPIDEYNKGALQIHSLKGQLFSIPRDDAPEALYYNKDAFDAAGLAYPDASWDWDDMRDAAVKLTEANNGRTSRYGLVMESNDWPTWIMQNGGNIFDDPITPTKFIMDEPAATEAVQFLGDLINKDKVMPSFQELDQSGGTTQMFVSGQAAMAITNAARLGSFGDANFNWAVAPLPHGRDGTRVNRSGGAGFGMNAFSGNKDAAWKFMQFLCGEAGQTIFASAKAAAVPAMVGNANVRAAFQAPFGDIFLDESKNGRNYPNFPGYVDITNLYIQPALDLVWSGEEDAKTAISSIEENVTKRLAESN
ncbi:sugar ABC transporter substrate-binding protein [Devosia rhodophyticola]|uniref:Sugar ABC transporter substrate-binding protein n=1 Tax=Devosia rhodophyticola TaxID=3026423 RepID=A0ABY7Z0G8_9HYPH|nr:sugar ABC transporter substrate-binding protein [Devosia rhodophyticola]WDR06823.1 sugar ABC transporter substrate-binding protein [Devosia rhodophyticola]